MNKHTIDFNLLPDLKYSTWMYNVGSEIEEGLKDLPETLRRAHTSMRCVYELACGENYSNRKEAHFRASLTEFVSMEEALSRDLKQIGIQSPPLKCVDTTDPVLHIVKALRNLEIHLQSSGLSSFKTTYLFGHKDKPEEAKEMDGEVWYIDDITPDAFNKLRDAKRYHAIDVVDLLNWFNEAQRLWGVYEIVRLAILRYSQQIISKYGFAPTPAHNKLTEGDVSS